MAEFLTMAEAEDKFGKKGRTNAALTLGIIGTALGAFAGNNGGCGCGNGGGLLGNLFGGNNNCCAMQAAKAEMKDKYPDGYVTNIFGKPVKFNDEDITQLLNLFKQFKQNK